MSGVEKFRMDSTTDVEDEYEGDDIQWSSDKVPLRFSFGHASQTDDPYRKNPSRQSKLPRASSPLPASQAEFQDHYGDRPWRCGDPHRYGAPKNGNSWHKCHQLSDKYDEEMCNAWKEEVDKLLIFAGLFSATITAFTIESYKWLKEGPEDSTVQLLAYLATQLTKNDGSLPASVAIQPFSVSSTDIRINTVWFLSLTLSLSTVLIGIMCLQWLREYQRDAALPHKDAVALRQMRFEGLLHWGVPEILSALPLLLQVSLILFFIGLLDLLWSQLGHVIVAASVSSAVAIVMLFLGVTTALPALQHIFTQDKHLRVPQCPYKSPQSWLFYQFGHALFWLLTLFELPWSTNSVRFHRLLKSAKDSNWLAYDMRWRRLRDATEVIWGASKSPKDGADLLRGLQWINDTFTQSVEVVYPIYHSLADLDVLTAANAVSELYIEVGQIDNATFRVMLDDRFSPLEVQKRDIISSYYLHLHQDTHPVLKSSYIESVIRILNSQDVPRPFYDWLSQILRDLTAVTAGKETSSASVSLINPEIMVQILICVKSLITKDRLRTLDIVMTWNLLHYLLYSPSVIIPEDQTVTVNVHHLRLACSLFDELEGWLTKGKEMDRWERVKSCAEGVLRVLPPAIDLRTLARECPDIGKAMLLVRSLDEHMGRMGGAAVVLRRDKWWHEYWDVYYDEEDWRALSTNVDGM